MSAIENIRTATRADAAAIAGIFAHYVRATVATFAEEPPTAADWVEKIGASEAAGMPFLTATADDEVIGFAYVSAWRAKPAYRHTVEDTIYLHPGHTGHGHGKALLAELLGRCRTAGFQQVIAVIADTGSPASTLLHRRAGFRDAGRLVHVGHKHGRWVDTTLMQLPLSAAPPADTAASCRSA